MNINEMSYITYIRDQELTINNMETPEEQTIENIIIDEPPSEEREKEDNDKDNIQMVEYDTYIDIRNIHTENSEDDNDEDIDIYLHPEK